MAGCRPQLLPATLPLLLEPLRTQDVSSIIVSVAPQVEAHETVHIVPHLAPVIVSGASSVRGCVHVGLGWGFLCTHA